MSRDEIKRLTRRYTHEIGLIIGPESDIPAPDMYTDAQVMAWMMDTYSMMKGYSVPGVVTGKPIGIGGSLCTDVATGIGLVEVLKEAVPHLGLKMDGLTVSVVGYGKVGVAASKFLSKTPRGPYITPEGSIGWKYPNINVRRGPLEVSLRPRT
jgi:glutamate dehydrogenase/leucine dehydrogenase